MCIRDRFKAELAAIPDSPEARQGLAALYKAQGREAEAQAILKELKARPRP